MEITLSVKANTGLPKESNLYIVYDVEDKHWMLRWFDAETNLFEGLVSSPTRYIWFERNCAIDTIEQCKAVVFACGYTDAKAVGSGLRWYIISWGTKGTDDYGFQTKTFNTEAEAWIDAVRLLKKNNHE